MVSPSAVVLTDFDYFWDLWPKVRRCAKPRARKAWDKAMARTTALTIMTALRAQLDARGGPFDTEPRYMPHPASWLNADRWDDEIVSCAPRLRNGAMAALLEMQEQGTLLEHQGDD